jgi:hypothetical protein
LKSVAELIRFSFFFPPPESFAKRPYAELLLVLVTPSKIILAMVRPSLSDEVNTPVTLSAVRACDIHSSQCEIPP